MLKLECRWLETHEDNCREFHKSLPVDYLITVINTSIWCCLASSMHRSFDSSYFCLIILTVQTFGPVTQSSFLQQMGIDTRMKVSGAHRPVKKSHWNNNRRRGKRHSVLLSNFHDLLSGSSSNKQATAKIKILTAKCSSKYIRFTDKICSSIFASTECFASYLRLRKWPLVNKKTPMFSGLANLFFCFLIVFEIMFEVSLSDVLREMSTE